ncbi:prepilin-type N-terminal cleavage/methylation domain-containing protein [Vibrio astriarenae]|uniref:prepilin-type N-terminal cleavage/methylation domain-containing protein n=1 Tax=Vibrio astriarenae TaxID=1481923 RepID=UPI003734D951
MKIRGFTLIEMIITIIIVAVIALGIAGFVEFGTKGFAQSVERQRLHTQAQFVLQKMSREIRHAVPNSLRVTEDSGEYCLSFYPIKYSGFYHQTGASIPYKLDFIVGQDIDMGQYDNSYWMVINPTSQADLDPITGNAISLENVVISGASSSLTLAQPLPSESVANRHYIYNNSERTYCHDRAKKRLYLLVENGREIQIADNIKEFKPDYLAPDLIRGGLVHLAIEVVYNDEVASYQQQVQVLNVP